jgi:hypothetical protein
MNRATVSLAKEGIKDEAPRTEPCATSVRPRVAVTGNEQSKETAHLQQLLEAL